MTTTTTRPRRMTEKQVAKVLREYDLPAKVRAHLETLGEIVWRRPEEVVSAPWSERFNTSARYREIVVLTAFGPLGLSLYEDWIACVFDDAEMGRIIGATVPSGKWNHHAFVGYCHKPTSKEDMIFQLDTMLSSFITRLGWIATGGVYDTTGTP